MAKIRNKLAYPLKKPVETDYFVGSDSENDGKTVNFNFPETAQAINIFNGIDNYKYLFSTDPNINLAVLTEGTFLTDENKTTVSEITQLYVNRNTHNGTDLIEFYQFVGVNSELFWIQLKNQDNLNNYVYFDITAIQEFQDYFIFDVVIYRQNTAFSTLENFGVYFFDFEIKQELPEGVDITGTKAEFNTSLTDGDFLFVGDITQYTDELAQDAVGLTLTDTATIDLSYNDGSNQITADLKNTTVSAGTYGTGQTIPTITFDAQGRATNVTTQAVDITSVFVSDFNEAAQDAVGSSLTDSTTIDLTYNDSGNQISADVKPNSIDATHLSNFINVSEFINDVDYATEAYADALVVSIFRPAGSWDASGNTFPTTGTGTAGVIRNGDTYNTNVAGTPVGFETLDIGDSFYAIVDSPGQTVSNWKKFEANTQQATESLRGTARIVTQAVIEDASTTNDTDIVTAKKFYLGWEKIKTLAQTFAAKITFITAPRFNSTTASTIPYIDSNKDLASSAVTPTELGYLSGTISPVQTQLNTKKDKTSTAVTSTFTLVNNGTTFSVSSLTGEIIDNSTVPAGRTVINFLGASNVTPLYLRTLIYIDNTGTLQQFNGASGDLTPLQKRDNLFIGIAVYIGGSVVALQKIPSVSYDTDGRLETFFESVGVINRDGNIIGANGANLQINKGAGHTQRSMSNYFIDRKVPDVTTDIAFTPIPAGVNLIGYRNGSGGWTYEAFTGSITPTFWDNGTGTKATVANNKFTIQRIYFFNGTDTFVIYLGQSEYSTLAAAEAAVNSTDRITDPATSPASLRSNLIVEKSCTALNNTTLAKFVEGPKISGGTSSGSGGAQSMQGTYNNSTTPQITTTTALGAIDFQRGSTADTDSVIRIKNGAGTVTAGITGNGAITGLTYNGYTPESNSNKATDFTTVNNALYPSVQAVKAYADGLVVGLLNDRGSYDASTNLYPSTGGSGTAGAVLKGNLWAISVAGTLGGVSVGIGDWVRALVDTPAQTAANWSVVEGNFGYVPANDTNVLHKTGNESFSGLKSSTNSTYPSLSAIIVTNNNNSGVLNSSDAAVMQVVNNQNSIGSHVSNTGIGIGHYGENSGNGNLYFADNTGTSGVLYKWNSKTGNTGDLLQISKNNSISGRLNHEGRLMSLNSSTYLDGGGAAAWLTLNGTTTYGGGLISSVNGTTKALYYNDLNYAVVQGSAGVGARIIVDGSVIALTAESTGVVKINNLSGSGTRNVVADASGNLSTDSTVYAPLASPALTGTPTAPTATAGTNTTQIATTAFVLANAGGTSGSFTPTITDGGNSSGATLVRASYTKTGDIVTAYYSIDTTSTSTTAFVTVNATLPVNRANSSSLNIGIGSVYVPTGGGVQFPVLGQSTATTSVNLTFKPTASLACNLTASIQYSILE